MANANPDANEKRRADFTVKDIQQKATEVAAFAEQLLATALLLKQKGVPSVRVDGVTKFERGMQLLDEFDGHVTLAIRKASPAKSATPKKATGQK